MKNIAVLTAVLVLAGCATSATKYPAGSMTQLDEHTRYAIEEGADGFNLTVAYSRYQFVPESSAVAIACKAALTSTAWEIAKQRGKKIHPVNEQRIKLSMGRNGFSGITSCSASAPVEWET